ncbi:hypothetical protein FHR54_001939 [Xanthomonas arboricola]
MPDRSQAHRVLSSHVLDDAADAARGSVTLQPDDPGHAT